MTTDLLLVEDGDADGELTLRALRRANLSQHIVWVRDGQEALDFLLGEGAWAGRAPVRPRVVLLDLKLPRVTGLEVLQRVRADPRTRDVPVVMLTSSAEARDIRDSYAAGANSYLVKPVDFAHLAEQVVAAGTYWLRSNQVPLTP